MKYKSLETAVILPCYNEEVTIAKMVKDFKKTLPGAKIYVFDNNSKDNTIKEAKKAGAIVQSEPLQGKGNVVRRMFADVEADIYIMADGDATYETAAAPKMIDILVEENLDMVVGIRRESEKKAYPIGHKFGNRMFNLVVSSLFGSRFTDIFSGYRVFSKRFVKSFPALSTGFETETELSVHALELSMPTKEIETKYDERPEGSESKLNTFKDGFRILLRIALLLKELRPLLFFSSIFLILFIASILIGIPVVSEFIDTGFVSKTPSAILATGTMVLAFLSLTSGVILDSVTRGRKEVKRLHYLKFKSILATLNDN